MSSAGGASPSGSGGQGAPSATSAAAVAAAAHAAATHQAAQQGSGSSVTTSNPAGAGGLGGAAPGGFPLMPAFPGGFPPNFLGTFFQQQQLAAQQAVQQAQAAAGNNGPATPSGGKGAKKQKGATGAAVGAPQQTAPVLSPAQAQAAQAAATSSPYASFLGSYNAMAAAAGAGGTLPGMFGGAVPLPGVGGGENAIGVPRGRWTEDMTVKLCELRTKMDARFRTVARPDRLWAEITHAITSQFGAHLPKQSTKDKWKNLRSNYRLINQGKHPSHYTKETWPYYHLLEQYHRVKAEHDSKNPNLMMHSTLNLEHKPSLMGMGGMGMEEGRTDEDSDGGDEGDDGDDGDEGDEHMDGDKKGGKTAGKKRARASSGAAAAVAAAAQAAAAAQYGSAPGHGVYGQQAVAQLGHMSPELLALLRPKDVSRKERDWASQIRTMTAQLTQNIQESHQHMIGLTHNVREIAEKMAPSATTRRVKLEASAAHAVRMAEVSLEVDVVRADLRHLPLLLPLFEQYRAFHAQPGEPEKLEEFLRDKLGKQTTVIFVALPVPGALAQAQAAAAAAAGVGDKGVPVLVPMSGGSGSDVHSITAAENAHANNLTSSHSHQGGTSQTTHSVSGPSRVGTRGGVLPAYALGFVQLIPSFSTLRLSRTWQLTDLFVAPSSRNKGVASLLLAHVRRFAADSGAAAIDLHTSVHNTHMQRMFARQEFNKQLETATFTHTLQ